MKKKARKHPLRYARGGEVFESLLRGSKRDTIRDRLVRRDLRRAALESLRSPTEAQETAPVAQTARSNVSQLSSTPDPQTLRTVGITDSDYANILDRDSTGVSRSFESSNSLIQASGLRSETGKEYRDRVRRFDEEESFRRTSGLRGYASGGYVKGPGGPREDKIPALLSNGEYVLPTDTTEAVGTENLDRLREVTSTMPEDPVTMKVRKSKLREGMKRQAPLRRAQGGRVNPTIEELNRRYREGDGLNREDPEELQARINEFNSRQNELILENQRYDAQQRAQQGAETLRRRPSGGPRVAQEVPVSNVDEAGFSTNRRNAGRPIDSSEPQSKLIRDNSMIEQDGTTFGDPVAQTSTSTPTPTRTPSQLRGRVKLTGGTLTDDGAIRNTAALREAFQATGQPGDQVTDTLEEGTILDYGERGKNVIRFDGVGPEGDLRFGTAPNSRALSDQELAIRDAGRRGGPQAAEVLRNQFANQTADRESVQAETGLNQARTTEITKGIEQKEKALELEARKIARDRMTGEVREMADTRKGALKDLASVNALSNGKSPQEAELAGSMAQRRFERMTENFPTPPENATAKQRQIYRNALDGAYFVSLIMGTAQADFPGLVAPTYEQLQAADGHWLDIGPFKFWNLKDDFLEITGPNGEPGAKIAFDDLYEKAGPMAGDLSQIITNLRRDRNRPRLRDGASSSGQQEYDD